MVETEKRETAVHGKPRAPLQDSLPEAHHYQDDGCDLAPACLRCPLPRCPAASTTIPAGAGG